MIKQLTHAECGLCCCAMILRYYKDNDPLWNIRDKLDAGRDGLDIKQLKVYLESKNFDVQIFKLENNFPKEIFKQPVIAFWQKKHYVVIEKFKKNTVTINDPSVGRYVMDKKEFLTHFSKYVLLPRPNDNFVVKHSRKERPWKYIKIGLSEKKSLLITIILLMIITQLLTLSIPISIQRIVDSVLSNTSSLIVYQFFAITLIISMLYVFFMFMRSSKLLALDVFLGKKLEAGTFKKLLNLQYKYFDVRTIGDLLYRLNSTREIKELIATQLIDGIINIGALIVIGIYMFYECFYLACISILIFILYFTYLLLIQPKFSQAIETEILENSKSYSLQVETLYSINSVKMSCLEDEIYQTWNDQYKSLIKKFITRMKLNNLSSVITNIVQLFGPILIFLIGIVLYLNGRLTMGEVFAFEAISNIFFNLGLSLFSSYSHLLFLSSYIERVAEIWSAPEEKYITNGIKKTLQGKLVLNNISFSYAKSSPDILKDISLTIEPGKKIAIVGESGSGKSTLSKIISGLYQPTKGNIFYDDISIDMFDRRSLYSQMAVVPQDTMLFNKSIYDNIVMNNTNVTQSEVENICKMVCIQNDIIKLPMGYETIVSEMGLNFSGGQRQRLLLARALINQPKILLLDEATSSLDSINENKIMSYLKQQKCTIIMISHRLSSIVDADIIYVMNNGIIAEFGSNDELLSKNGLYAKLYQNNQSFVSEGSLPDNKQNINLSNALEINEVCASQNPLSKTYQSLTL